MPTVDPKLVLRVAMAAFLAILFLQSGLDKVTDRKGNLDWLTGHFAKSPLAGLVPLLLGVITLLELAAGGLCLAGGFQLLFGGTTLALWGAILSVASIVCLFFGQRVAKDYAGATGLVPYFLTAMLGVWLFG